MDEELEQAVEEEIVNTIKLYKSLYDVEDLVLEEGLERWRSRKHL